MSQYAVQLVKANIGIDHTKESQEEKEVKNNG